MAGQSKANGKSKIFLETSPVTIDDKDFDCWVGNCQDISLEPRPIGAPQTLVGMAVNSVNNYQALSKNALQDNWHQHDATQPSSCPPMGGRGTQGQLKCLSTGKGFDQDQIVKLKDACGVCNAQQIPPIWSVIQASKGKSFDTYRAHLSKSVDAWCHLHHINHDTSPSS